jgi:hypothetical protein
VSGHGLPPCPSAVTTILGREPVPFTVLVSVAWNDESLDKIHRTRSGGTSMPRHTQSSSLSEWLRLRDMSKPVEGSIG